MIWLRGVWSESRNQNGRHCISRKSRRKRKIKLIMSRYHGSKSYLAVVLVTFTFGYLFSTHTKSTTLSQAPCCPALLNSTPSPK
jgi:hypothetical protein